MRNDETGASAHQLVHAFLDQSFGQGIDRAGSFVHDKDIRISQQGACNTDELFLPHRELISAFANVLTVSFFKVRDEFVRASQLGGVFNLFIGCVQSSIA